MSQAARNAQNIHVDLRFTEFGTFRTENRVIISYKKSSTEPRI